jgi:hypothetical protein
LENIQSFRLHHLPNIGHKRRLKKELLSWENWSQILAEKKTHPLSVQYVYDNIIYQQYNLHLIDYRAIAGKVKFVRWK